MSGTKAVHQCLFCPQIFDNAVAKDDHILEHFPQETCSDCDQNLIRIGSNLYTLHNAMTCIERESKPDVSIQNESQIETTTQNHDESDCNATLTSSHVVFDQLPNIKLEPEIAQTEELMSADVDPMNFAEAYHNEKHKEFEDQYNVATDATPSNTILLPELEIKMDPCVQEERFIFDGVTTEPIIDKVYDQDSSQVLPSQSRPIALETSSVSNNENGLKYKDKCDICLKYFRRSYDVKIHKKYAHSDPGTVFGQFECTICNKKFKRKEYFSKHMKFKHNPDRIKYTCRFCFAVFMSPISLDNHHGHCVKRKWKLTKLPSSGNDELIKTELGDEASINVIKMPTADIINVTNDVTATSDVDFTSTNEVLQKKTPAIKSVKSSDAKNYQCPVCEEWFQCASKLKQHNIYNHTEKGRFECAECHRIFLREPSLRKHCRLKHSGKTYSCRFCSVQFVLEKSLEDHLTRCKLRNKHIGESKEIRTCTICEKVLANPKSLRTHQFLLHNAGGHRCNHCKILFHSAKGLANHGPKCSKTSTITFECFMCHKPCNSKRYLGFHVRMKHDSNDRNFKCEMCEKYFPCRSALEAHMNRIHLKLDFRTHMCSVCGKTFTSKRYLKFHELSHSGTKTLKCTYDGCDRYFAFPESRADHIKHVHKGEKRFICKICNEGFGGATGFKKHKLNVHGIA